MTDDAHKTQSPLPPTSSSLPVPQRLAAAPRPVFLGILTVLGMIAAFPLGMVFLEMRLPMLTLLQAVCFAVWFSLRRGRYWAWVAIQLLWGLNMLFVFFQPDANLSGIVVAVNVWIILMLYIHSGGVKAFCGVGKQSWETD